MSQVIINQNQTTGKRLTASKRFVFNGFEYFPEKQQLLYQGTLCLLEPKMLKLINLLIQARPNVVSKEELLDKLWPDSVVAESSLSRLVSDTRKLMEDNGKRQAVIKTVRGKGFCFFAQVDEIIAPSPFQHQERRKNAISPTELNNINQLKGHDLKSTKHSNKKYYVIFPVVVFLAYIVFYLVQEALQHKKFSLSL